MILQRGSSQAPLHLREGETDRFYFIYADALASGDELIGSPSITSDGLTISGEAINSAPLTLGGVQYPAGTVVEFIASNIRQGDKAQADCLVNTQAGRLLKDSMFIRGVNTYHAG